MKTHPPAESPPLSQAGSDSSQSSSSSTGLGSTNEPETPSRLSVAVFPRRSVNLICSSSNSGKTTLIRNMLKFRKAFFEPGGSDSVCYFNCNTVNNRTNIENPFEDDQEADTALHVQVYALEEVGDIREVVRPGQIVILDDVFRVTESVNYFLSYASNHLDLIVFVVTQACLSTDLFQLVYKAHTLTAVYTNSSSVRLGKFLMSSFFLSTEKKQLIRKILERAEANGWTVTLKLNTVASASDLYKYVVAFAGISHLCGDSRPYCLVFVEPGKEGQVEGSLMELGHEVQPEDFILVRASQVSKPPSGSVAEASPRCLAKDHWTLMNERLLEEVESAFDFKQRHKAVVLLKEILRVPEFCVSSDYRSLLMKSRKKIRASIIDLLQVATRRSHPKEDSLKFQQYVPFVKALLKRKIPTTYIKNAKLLELASAAGRNKVKRKEEAEDGDGSLLIDFSKKQGKHQKGAAKQEGRRR